MMSTDMPAALFSRTVLGLGPDDTTNAGKETKPMLVVVFLEMVLYHFGNRAFLSCQTSCRQAFPALCRTTDTRCWTPYPPTSLTRQPVQPAKPRMHQPAEPRPPGTFVEHNGRFHVHEGPSLGRRHEPRTRGRIIERF